MEPLVETRIAGVDGVPALEWTKDLTVRLPVAIAQALAGNDNPENSITVTAQAAQSARAAYAETMHHDLRLRAAFTRRRPASSRLPLPYHVVPAWARRLVARGIGRVKRRQVARWASFPGWPIDLSADFLADLVETERSPLLSGKTPVLLTHDIDSPEGLQNLVRDFLDLEEQAGARSCNYIVPCAWPIDHGLLRAVEARGHEIGIHGYDHGNRTPFAETDERRRRIDGARPLVERYGVTGYRAPSFLRTEALLNDLGRLYRYDSSIPTAGGLFPVPNNGCATARPWRLGNLWEIPVTLPRDGSLRFLGHSPAEIGRLWQQIARTIAQSAGIVCLLTHCEAGFSGNAAMLETYRGFLQWVAGDPRFEFLRPADLVGKLDRTLREDIHGGSR
jgi:hypothetical protein